MIQGFVLAALMVTAAAVAAPDAAKPDTAEIERRGSYGYQPPRYDFPTPSLNGGAAVI